MRCCTPDIPYGTLGTLSMVLANVLYATIHTPVIMVQSENLLFPLPPCRKLLHSTEQMP